MAPNILIVEDERDIADLIHLALTRANMRGHIAATATTAKQALAHHPFDLLLLDVGLPDENGFDFLKSFRQQNTLPIIILTAQDSETDRVLGLELGADDYLGKPFSPRELIGRIKAVLRRSQPQPTTTTAPDWQDDKIAHCIRYRGISLPLTLGEYRLMRQFIHHPKQVFTRETLLTAMFDSQHPSDPRTIDTHIRALRRKLHAANISSSHIQTHHGIGYSFQHE